MSKGTILCVDDEPNVLSTLRRLLESDGFLVFLASSGKDALSILEKEDCDIALIDYLMPEMNGIELIEKIKENNYEVELIIVTAYGDVSLIVRAIKAGAYDYILKPWNSELLISTINKVVKYKTLLREKNFLNNQLKKKYGFENLVGVSSCMRKIFEIIEKVKNTDDVVLICGESGTGKEQVARAIHYSGNRKNELFLPVDCVSLSPTIIESELFGHIKGAFTGASQDNEGLLKSAGKGTIFFDEIAEIPPNIQAKLLRVIQEMSIKPVGSTKSENIEARIISATSKNLTEAIENGEFRIELFYRLNVVSIEIPPLREHKEDIPYLVNHFVDKYATDESNIKGISPEVLDVLMNYNWPGNIRQLENCIERAFTLGANELITISNLSEEILSKKMVEKSGLKTLAELEREQIIRTILQLKGNKRKSAEILGIAESTLYNKLKAYNIDL
jgi:DNA-binding NtrC family response regulator